MSTRTQRPGSGVSAEVVKMQEVSRLVAETLAEVSQRLVQIESSLDSLRTDVAATQRLQKHLYMIQRRDLSHALDVDALTSSARFIRDHLPTTPRFPHAYETLRHAARLATVPGLVLEFGVATGTTLRILAEELPERSIFGFDAFTGLPEDWRTGFAAGTFAQEPPDVPGAQLVVGLFEDTVPGFAAEHPEPISLLHLDADLYSSTATVLEHVGPHLVDGSVVVFDEYLNYPGWENHEHKAWQEYVDRTGTQFSYEGYTANGEQLAIRVTHPGDPDRHRGQ
jgi:predicted O-methyltransferase YrrM